MAQVVHADVEFNPRRRDTLLPRSGPSTPDGLRRNGGVLVHLLTPVVGTLDLPGSGRSSARLEQCCAGHSTVSAGDHDLERLRLDGPPEGPVGLATLIRMVFVPAVMTLLRQWNWYLPSWLQWLV